MKASKVNAFEAFCFCRNCAFTKEFKFRRCLSRRMYFRKVPCWIEARHLSDPFCYPVTETGHQLRLRLISDPDSALRILLREMSLKAPKRFLPQPDRFYHQNSQNVVETSG